MAPTFLPSSSFLDAARKFGPLAFVGVGLADQSLLPLPGSMDALVILFVAARPQLWWYYALLATGGTTLGAYLTYRLSMREGKAALERRIGKQRAEKAYRVFDRWGFWSVFIGTILPPPMPILPFVASAGAMQYPRHLFLTAYASGRIVRFGVVAWITKAYGRSLFQFLSQYYEPSMYLLIGLAVAGGIVGFWFYRRRKKAKPSVSQKRRAA